MMSLKVNVEALDEPQDTERGRRPPINDAVVYSFHTKMDGLGKKTHTWVSELTEMKSFYDPAACERYLRRGLQISEGNDFFVDKKLNGLLLPVVHIAVQLIGVHPCRTDAHNSSLMGHQRWISMDSGGAEQFGGHTSSKLQTCTLLFLIDLQRLLPVAAILLHHGSALVHQLLHTHKHC